MAKTIVAYLGLGAILLSAAISAYLVWVETSWQQIIAALAAFVAATSYYLTSPVFKKTQIVDLDASNVYARGRTLPEGSLREGDLSMHLEITVVNRGDPMHDVRISSGSRFNVSLMRSVGLDLHEPVSYLGAGESADIIVSPGRSDDTTVPFAIHFRNRDGQQKLRGGIQLRTQQIVWR